MFERFGDLPLHVLVIHLAVVVLPVAALTAIVFALVPRWRWFLRWPALVLGVGALVCAFVAGLTAFPACQEAAEGGDPLGVGSARGDGLVQGAVGGRLGVGAATGAVRGDLGQVGEGVDQLVRIDVGQAERADAGGVDDPAV